MILCTYISSVTSAGEQTFKPNDIKKSGCLIIPARVHVCGLIIGPSDAAGSCK